MDYEDHKTNLLCAKTIYSYWRKRGRDIKIILEPTEFGHILTSNIGKDGFPPKIRD